MPPGHPGTSGARLLFLNPDPVAASFALAPGYLLCTPLARTTLTQLQKNQPSESEGLVFIKSSD
jgi:hypothetical protein